MTQDEIDNFWNAYLHRKNESDREFYNSLMLYEENEIPPREIERTLKELNEKYNPYKDQSCDKDKK